MISLLRSTTTHSARRSSLMEHIARFRMCEFLTLCCSQCMTDRNVQIYCVLLHVVIQQECDDVQCIGIMLLWYILILLL